MEFQFEGNETVDESAFSTKVPQEFQPLYEKGEQGYVLRNDYAGVAKSIDGLNRANRAARLEAKDAKKNRPDLSLLSDYGSTPEEIKQAFDSKMEELQQQVNSKSKIDIDKIKNDLQQGHAKELEARDKRNQALTNRLYKEMVENKAVAEITEAKGAPKLLMPHIHAHVKVVEENDDFSTYVVDKDGHQRYSGVTGQPMTIKELVAEMKADPEFGRCFESEAPSGGGTHPAGPGRRQPTGQRPQKPVDKIAAGLAARKKTYGVQNPPR